MADDKLEKVILRDCMQRLIASDPDAGFDLAQFVMAELPNNDISVLLAIVEGLIRQSEQLGSTHAKTFLAEIWPYKRKMIKRRMIKGGCSDEWDVENLF